MSELNKDRPFKEGDRVRLICDRDECKSGDIGVVSWVGGAPDLTYDEISVQIGDVELMGHDNWFEMSEPTELANLEFYFHDGKGVHPYLPKDAIEMKPFPGRRWWVYWPISESDYMAVAFNAIEHDCKFTSKFPWPMEFVRDDLARDAKIYKRVREWKSTPYIDPGSGEVKRVVER